MSRSSFSVQISVHYFWFKIPLGCYLHQVQVCRNFYCNFAWAQHFLMFSCLYLLSSHACILCPREPQTRPVRGYNVSNNQRRRISLVWVVGIDIRYKSNRFHNEVSYRFRNPSSTIRDKVTLICNGSKRAVIHDIISCLAVLSFRSGNNRISHFK